MLLSTAYHWQQLSLGLSYHRNEARLDGERLNVYEYNGLGTSLGDTWTAFADYRASDNLTLGWQGRFVRGIDTLHTGVGDVSKPGYGVHDLYAEWQAVPESLTVTLTLKNLLDKRGEDYVRETLAGEGFGLGEGGADADAGQAIGQGELRTG